MWRNSGRESHLNPFLQALIDYWRSHRVRPAEPASETQVRTFEDQYGIEIIPEFRAYLMSLNGMRYGDCDDNLFEFWQIDRIRTVAEECPDSQRSLEEGRYFVFADYMMWSWAYAVDLAS